MPTVAAVKTTPVLIALYPRISCRKTETTNEMPMQQQPLDVLRDEREVARAVLEQPGGQQRLLARPLAGADVEEEPDQEERADDEEDHEQRVVGPGLEDPEHEAEHADPGEDRPDRVEGPRRVGRQRIDDPAAQQDDRRDDQGLEDERGAPADRRS